MGMTDKESLLNAITLRMAEDYGLKISEVKCKVGELLKQYHVSISDETFSGECLTTEYLFDKFSRGKEAVGMSKLTLRQYKIAVNGLEKYTGKRLSDIEAEDIMNWLRDYGKTVSKVTLKGKYQLISSVYSYLYNRRYLPSNPIAYTDAPKADVIYKNPLTDTELESIKKACETLPEKESLRDMALIHFFISTGCRISEVRSLRLENVNLDTKTCVVMGKGRKERPVVLSDRACYRLKLYLESRTNLEDTAPLFASIRGEEHEMTKDGIEHIIHKIRDLADVPNLTCHVFRRFYATEMRRRNVPLQMIATSLGHANMNQINRYSLYDNREMLSVLRQAM